MSAGFSGKIADLHCLQDCTPETRERFEKEASVFTLPKRSLCLRAGETNERVLFLLGGMVQVYNLTGNGQKKILFLFGPDTMLNDNLFGSLTRAFCETMDRCTFAAVPRTALLDMMRQDFALTEALSRITERRVWRLEHQLKNTVGSIYLERKLAAKLWKLSRDFGVSDGRETYIDAELSVTFLADLLGVPRETTSRVCKRLTEEGLIRLENKRLYLPDPEGLSRFFRDGASQQKKVEKP